MSPLDLAFRFARIRRISIGPLRAPTVLAAMLLVAVLAPLGAVGSTTTRAGASGLQQEIGGIGLRLTEAPVSAGDDPRARLYIVDHLAPGTVIERRIEVSNTTTSSQRVALYAAGASIDAGTFVGAAGATPNELSSWTSVTPEATEVAADGTMPATVTVAIPDDAAPGERYGVVWAEVRSTPDEQGGLTQVNRVGIRMYVSVGPGGPPAADFTIDSMTADRSVEGLPMLSADVHNTGGRALDLAGTLTLSNGPGGLSAGPFAVNLGRTLAIDDTQPVHVMLDDRLPAGPWDASITLASGLIERTAEGTITFPEGDGAPAVATAASATTRSWLVPTAIGVVAFLVVCAVLLALRRRRRRRRLSALRWGPPLGPSIAAPNHP